MNRSSRRSPALGRYTVFGGNPAQHVGDLPEAFPEILKESTARLYRRFQPEDTAKRAGRGERALGECALSLKIMSTTHRN